ncbi:Asp23/Gls24 family envelope stress response protein [Rubrobacter taiwanensis]|uniref:Asp23/Gls24 family envelope stress response protein n=1 Tax=Rubrobacter taiwanensis TaxID=185139 RepID=UPI0014050B3F|nr:Asp23/Gls24 family envelope stress response protein [Rubrobacter taiwanensis]
MTEQRSNYRVEDSVVTKIAGLAVQETEGLRPNTDAPDLVEGTLDQVSGSQSRPQGVSADIGDSGATIDLTVAVEYGRKIPQITEAARQNVIRQVEQLAGVSVREVNIRVNDVYDPAGERRREG